MVTGSIPCMYHMFVHQSFLNEKPFFMGLERGLGGSEHLLPLQRTWVCFQHPRDGSQSLVNSSSREL